MVEGSRFLFPACLLNPGDRGLGMLRENNGAVEVPVTVEKTTHEYAIVVDRKGRRYKVSELYVTMPSLTQSPWGPWEEDNPVPRSIKPPKKPVRPRAPVRLKPYPMDTVDLEKWRWYWMGKAPRVRAATEEYLAKYATPEHMKMAEIALKHGVTEIAVRVNIKKLVDANIIPGPHTHLGPAALKRRNLNIGV